MNRPRKFQENFGKFLKVIAKENHKEFVDGIFREIAVEIVIISYKNWIKYEIAESFLKEFPKKIRNNVYAYCGENIYYFSTYSIKILGSMIFS